MRIDPESPRAKAKMRALDRLSDVLDYSNTKRKEAKQQGPDAEVETQEHEIHATGIGESQNDSGNDREPDDFSGNGDRARALVHEGDADREQNEEGDFRGPMSKDNGDDDGDMDAVHDAGQQLAAYKTIDMRQMRREGMRDGGRDGISSEKFLRDEAPAPGMHNDDNMTQRTGKKHRR